MAKSSKQSNNVEKKKLNSFFSGIGGFDLAFERNGFQTSFYCENNKFCRSVLKRHWPKVKNAGDIRELDANELPQAEVWVAGFPCQDLSLARTPHGKRSGLKGERSGLFYSFLEHLKTRLPPVVLLENVAGLLNSHKGADFKALVTSLTSLGYAVAWRVLNARYFGVPQSRPRIFICAWLGAPSKAVSVLFENEIAAKPKNERHGFMKESHCAQSGASVAQLSFCISATSGRHTGLDWARSYITYPNAVRRLTPLECERLQGLPDHWTMPDKDYVIPIRGIETNRYHAVGNAVCVPVVSWVASRISAGLDATDEIRPLTDKAQAEEQLQKIVDSFIHSGSKLQELTVDIEESKWCTGGIAFKDWFATAPVSSAPVQPVSSVFVDLIEKGKIHDRYYLSVNAMQGILRRVDKLGRNLFPPLDVTLRRVVLAAPSSGNETQEDSIELKEIIAK